MNISAVGLLLLVLLLLVLTVPNPVHSKPLKTLVILHGQQRGGPAAWRSLARNLLEPYQADLATTFAVTDPMLANLTAGPQGWFLDLGQLNPDELIRRVFLRVNQDPLRPLGWFCNLSPSGRLWGQVPLCGAQQGASGLMLAERQALIDLLRQMPDYDYYILTRADYYYQCRFRPVFPPPGVVLTMAGEGYGGVNDRFILFHRRDLQSVLGLVEEILGDYPYWHWRLKGLWDIERLLAEVYRKKHLVIYEAPRVGYLIRDRADETRWSTGKELGRYVVKYPSEFYATQQSCSKDLPLKNIVLQQRRSEDRKHGNQTVHL